MLVIRAATLPDLDAITEIYNEAILKTIATFDTTPKTLEEQKAWFFSHNAKYPILAAEKDKVIVGWASLSMWSDRCAYSDTAEMSLYVREKEQRKGIGRKLAEAMLREGQKAGLHTVLARIAAGNEISIHLAEAVGFKHVGVMKEVGLKFGRRLDVHLMQKVYTT